MTEFESLRTSFNDVADLYDEVRSGYQIEVINEIVAFADLPVTGRILEIGCGTGQITVPFALRGYPILALEPGAALAALAVRKCQPYENVKILRMSFEEWPVQFDSFDLVLSAQAFHWIEPYSGCEKAAKALHHGGSIALVWINDLSQGTSIYKSTRAIYDKFLPAQRSNDSARTTIHEILHCSKAFENVLEIRFPGEKTYPGSEYLKLMNTFSDHQRLPEPSKALFFQAIAEVINREGGTVTKKHETQILLARRT
jgi:SAM-dependent methyltransferase